jgi:CBS domain containing-hemolysin-like protein
LLAILIFSPLFLLLTEVVPKSIFQQEADRLAPRVIWPLRGFMVLLFPVVYSFAAVARMAARLTGGRATHHAFMTREMLRAVLDTSEKTSDVTPLTWGRLKQAVKFADVAVAEVMIPMAEVTAISDQTSTRDAVSLARRRGHFRVPVYRGTSSSVVGVLAMDLWRLMTPDFTEQALEALMSPALFVAPQRPVVELLPLLRQRDDRMAVVVDEFGSAIGMITLEDIQETVLGEFVGVGYNIPGYVHRERHDYEQLGEDTYVLDGRFGIAEVNDLLGIDLPTREAHTIGGFLTAELRHLPRPGESVTARGFRFTVLEANDRVVRSVRVEPL